MTAAVPCSLSSCFGDGVEHYLLHDRFLTRGTFVEMMPTGSAAPVSSFGDGCYLIYVLDEFDHSLRCQRGK